MASRKFKRFFNAGAVNKIVETTKKNKRFKEIVRLDKMCRGINFCTNKIKPMIL